MNELEKVNAIVRMMAEFEESWISAVNIMGMLRYHELVKPVVNEYWYAAMYGLVDSVGQSVGADQDTTLEALRSYLSQLRDGENAFGQIKAAGSNPQLLQMVWKAGEAVYWVRTGKEASDNPTYHPMWSAADYYWDQTRGPIA